MTEREVLVHVTRVHIPAMSTVGEGEGWTEQDGTIYRVWFAGDHRPMRDLGEALARYNDGDDEVIAVLPMWAIRNILPSQEGGRA